VKVCPTCNTEFGDDAAFCSHDRSPLWPSGRADRDTEDLVGRVVGERYQVERRIGAGGMGEVYLARHVLMGRPSALKVLKRDLIQEADAISRFNREATNASRIAHPNVCGVYDFGLTADGLVFLAMEYLEGRTLRETLADWGPLPVDRATALLGQCAAGLQAAHDLGIVHRDLKPENVMIGGPDHSTAKLVDFGIAKAVAGDSGPGVTRSGFIVGTPEYMSPEQLAGVPLDARSDQYSLGLLYYEMLTGAHPFTGDSVRGSLAKRMTDRPRPLTETRPSGTFPPKLQSVIDRVLARRPEERYPSVRDFAAAASAAAADRGVSAGARPVNWIAIGLGALVLLAALWLLLGWRSAP
jgi:serine/threonine-protein kinase